MTDGAVQPPGSGLAAVRAAERTLAARVDQRAAAERACADARTSAEAILARARERGASEAAALRAQRLEDAARQAAAIIADAHVRAEREASWLLDRRAELTDALLTVVLPAIDQRVVETGPAGG